MFSLICVWINGWVNNREAGNLRRYRAHYDVIVKKCATVYIMLFSKKRNQFDLFVKLWTTTTVIIVSGKVTSWDNSKRIIETLRIPYSVDIEVTAAIICQIIKIKNPVRNAEDTTVFSSHYSATLYIFVEKFCFNRDSCLLFTWHDMT